MINFVALVFLAGILALLWCSYIAARKCDQHFPNFFDDFGCEWFFRNLSISVVYGFLTLLPVLIVIMAVLCLIGISRGEL